MRLAGLCLLLATPAVADVVETREDAIADVSELEPITAKQIGWRYRLDAAAAGVASSTGKERQGGAIGTASGVVALTTRADCDLFMLGGLLSARTDERLVSGSFWGTFCPIGGQGHLVIDHRLDWDVTPRLMSAPVLRPGPSRRATQGLELYGRWRPYHAEDDADDPTTTQWVQGGRARFEVAVGWTEPTGVMEDLVVYLDATTFTYRRDDDGKPFTLDVLYVRGEALTTLGPDEPSTMVGSLRMDGIRFEGYRAGAFILGGRLGGRLGAISRIGTAFDMNMIALGEGGLSAELGPVRVAAERASYPVWDGRLLVDNRATTGLRGTLGKLRGNLEFAAAYTQLFSADIYRKGFTGGVVAELDYGLTDYLSLRARSEVGRTFYAQQMLVDEPVWASETMVLLSAHTYRGIKR